MPPLLLATLAFQVEDYHKDKRCNSVSDHMVVTICCEADALRPELRRHDLP